MTITEIQQLVCTDYRVSMLELLSARRGQDIVAPRQVAMWLVRRCTKHSIPQIGRAFGRDHTTVLHALARIDRRIETDESFVIRLGRLKRIVDSENNGETSSMRIVA